MIRLLLLSMCTVLAPLISSAAADTSKVVWAFPITSYILPLQKSATAVQVVTPPSIKFEKDKQIGLLRGTAKGDNVDTGVKGWGKCHLIKGKYSYFGIKRDSSAKRPKEGDLIYTFIPKAGLSINAPLFPCAANAITFTTVQDTPFYLPADFLKPRTAAQDAALMRRMLDDVHYTASFFAAADTSKNLEIPGGSYRGQRVLEVMRASQENDLAAFLQFVAARPRRYAGNTWKLSETFATWILHGGPVIIADE